MSHDLVSPSDTDEPLDDLQQVALAIIAEVMHIEQQQYPEWEELSTEDRAIIIQGDVDHVLTVEGQLKQDSESAYEILDNRLRAHQMTPLFRETVADGKIKHVIHILEGRLKTPSTPSPIPNIVLLILTIASLLYIGTITAIGEIRLIDPEFALALRQNMLPELWRGYPYAISLLLILGSHEMAHWLMMRKYKVIASLPYFIPSFTYGLFGTFGAIIITKGAIRNRKALFDIGVSGPLAGLVFCIPILFVGLATSPVIEISGGLVEGNSLVYALSKILIFGEFLPNGTSDVILNQLAKAGWTGLFVTALNLIPLGQLDGGHIMYALWGQKARRFYIPILGMLLFLALFVYSLWMLWFFMLWVLGRVYAVPLDDITSLDPTRHKLAIAILIILGLIFIPAPITTPDGSGGLLTGLLIIMTWQSLRNIVNHRK
jgi:Zn-dependent protease